MSGISIIVPVYKQEKTIRKNLEDLLDALKVISMPMEIIVVVDGMIDRSFDEIKSVKSKKIKVYGYLTNHGKGYAVRFGIAKAKYSIIGFIDAGGDLNLKAFLAMLEQFRWMEADIVIGSKRHPDSKVEYPLVRKILSRGYQTIIRFFFGLNIRDTQVGMKIYKRKVLEEVLPRLLVKKFAFDIELLAVANYLGYRKIYEAPVELYYKFNSTITSANFWKTVFSMLVDTLAVFYRLKIVKYYDDNNKRKWKYDPELNFRINIG